MKTLLDVVDKLGKILMVEDVSSFPHDVEDEGRFVPVVLGSFFWFCEPIFRVDEPFIVTYFGISIGLNLWPWLLKRLASAFHLRQLKVAADASCAVLSILIFGNFISVQLILDELSSSKLIQALFNVIYLPFEKFYMTSESLLHNMLSLFGRLSKWMLRLWLTELVLERTESFDLDFAAFEFLNELVFVLLTVLLDHY